MRSQPHFLQGVFTFSGQGLDAPLAVDADLVYLVPSDRRAQLTYFRAGNSAPELIYLRLLRDGKVMRLFPIGGNASIHVTLAVVEDLEPATRLEVQVAAPIDSRGTLVLDVGFLEI